MMTDLWSTLRMIPGETLQSIMPYDIPWWMPDHFVFMGAFYTCVIAILAGVGYVVIKSLKDTMRKDPLSDSGESNGHGH